MASAVESNAPARSNSRPVTPKAQLENEAPLPPVPTGDASPRDMDSAQKERLQHILSSDIGTSTLLNRLKQSLSSTRDFGAFLRERSALEEKHAQSLKRLNRSTQDSIGRQESRQGSFAENYRELASIHDRMADHSLQFCNALFAMSEELHELAANNERGRKQWKQTGLNAEKRVQDAEAAMEKAKGRYNSLAEQFDRTRTGEKQGGKFGLKKSGAQAEEDLRQRVDAADTEYATKVVAAQAQRNELMSTHRPQTVNALQELIRETDAGLSVQMQKFANLTERLLLGHGLSVTPLKGQSPVPGQSSRSLREVASGINNERDLNDYILSVSSKVPSRASEIKYEKHPSFSPRQQNPGYSDQSYGGGSFPSSHGRQVSGGASYPAEDRYDESRFQGPPSGGFGSGPQQPNPQVRSNGPPQLPQIDSSGGGSFSGGPDAVSPIGADAQSATMGPGHMRNVSSVGSMGAPGQQSFDRPPVQGGISSVQMPGGFPTGRDQAPFDRGQPSQDVGRGQTQGMGRGGPSPADFGRGQGAFGSTDKGELPQPPSYSMQSPQSRLNQHQIPDTKREYGQPPQPSMHAGQGLPGSGGMQQGAMAYGQPSTGAMNRGAPLSDMSQDQAPQAMERGQATQAPTGMGQSQGFNQQQSLPPPGAGRGMIGQGQNGPLNGGPRAGGLNALPSRQAAQRAGPPVRPVFGVSLDDLFQREGDAVPIIVNQCVQAVNRYGLNVEGIYRTSGSANNIMEMRQQFDYDANAVDFSTPAGFHEDIASVTTLLKHFLRDLPDPLLTAAQYQDFIAAARIEEPIVRRDQIHGQVNTLPDPNYATLRVLAIHLHRVAQHSDRNKMTHNNLAIVFAPTLMGQRAGVNGNGLGSADLADSGWQVKVVESILDHTYQIFEGEE